MRGIIVGIDKNSDEKQYRVITINNKGFNKYSLQEKELINVVSSGKLVLDNASVVNGALKGTTGDLNRFNSGKIHPMVVISEVVADGKTVGYMLATYEGKIQAVRLKDVLAYCARVQKSGIPFQNAMYVPETETQKAHLRAYPGHQFQQNTITRNKTKVAQPASVDKKANEKQVSKLEELFTPAQIKQLKLGKQHGVDIRIFGNNKLSAEQMQELRKALEEGVNAKAFADPAYSVSAMKALRINAKYGVDITYFVNPKFNAEQIYELSTGYLSGVDINEYADPTMPAKDMAKKRVYMESQLWFEIEAEAKAK